MTPDTLVAVPDLQAIVAATGHHIVLIGAYAREVTFDRAIGIRSPRATRDVDTAVRIAGWAEFERLAAEIAATRRARCRSPASRRWMRTPWTPTWAE